MSEKYVAEYIEILDDHGERKGVCVTDTEHTVSFEVKDEYVAMELCDLLNKLYEENKQLRNQLLICQQSKNDAGRFQVWEVPPIPKGTRITFSTTTERSGKNE